MSASSYAGPWPLDPFRVWPLRREVLRPHQPVEASEYEGDDDPLALHVGVLQGDEVVACGSLFPEDGWRIRGMATLEAHRGRGLGTAVLEALIRGAAQRGGGRVWCNARTSAAPFYRERGMEERGGVFELEGLGPHRVMAVEVPAAEAGVGFELGGARELLRRTPGVLDAWCRGLPPSLADRPEGPGRWSVRDVVGHLLHGEEDDWIVRVQHILGPDSQVPFRPFERRAMVRRFHDYALDRLLDDFRARRADALRVLESLDPGPEELDRIGVHPTFGPVTLRQLMAAWVAHDLGHLAQIARILVAPVAPDVGPWSRFISIVRD